MGPHSGGVACEVAEEPGRGERAPIASWGGESQSHKGGMRQSEEARVSEEAVRMKGGVRRSQGMEDGLRMERRRSPRESRESLRQGGRAQSEVRKPKCQRRLY
jgi:hypothetical protein